MIAGVVEHLKANGGKTIGYIGFADGWGDLVLKALEATAAELRKLPGAGQVIAVAGDITTAENRKAALAACPQVMFEIAVRHQFERQPQPSLALTAVDDAHHILVTHLLHHRDLAVEALGELGIAGQVGTQEFHRHRAAISLP